MTEQDVIYFAKLMVESMDVRPEHILMNFWDVYKQKVTINGKRVIKRLPRKLKKELKKHNT